MLYALSTLCLLLGAYAWEEMYVTQPSSLAEQFPEGVDHKPAMFGIPSYTTSITGNVVYATSGDRDGCAPLDSSEWVAAGHNPPYIVMVDRGNCSFVEKVRNVQNAQGSVAIIVDNVEETYLPYMADDGTGEDITIPSILISLDDGQLFKDTMETGFVTVQMTWGLPHPDGRVEWSLWTSSNDPTSREMKQDWGVIVESLGEAAQFTPHYFILDGALSGCTTESLPCGNQCTPDGKYCAVDPDYDLSSGISGEDIVYENLRQMCLFDYLNTTEGESTVKWWDYSSQFIDECCQPEDHVTGVCTAASFNAECSYGIMESINIADTDAVRACTEDRMEELFDDEILLRLLSGIFFMPTLIINNAPYRGSLTCADPINAYDCGPLEAICAGYASGTAPDTCYGDRSCPFGEFVDCANVCDGTSEVDACGVCAIPGTYLFNVTCAGCDGVPHSGLVNDPCGVCGGDGSFDACGRCWAADDTRRINDEADCEDALNGETSSAASLTADFNLTVIAVGIACGALLVVVAACLWAKHQQAQIARIDSVLSSYLPLDQANDFAHPDDDDLSGVHMDSTMIQ